MISIYDYDRDDHTRRSKRDNQSHFDSVLSFVKDFLDRLAENGWSTADEDYNKLTYEIINLACRLALFGFYNFGQLLELSSTVLKIVERLHQQQVGIITFWLIEVLLKTLECVVKCNLGSR